MLAVHHVAYMVYNETKAIMVEYDIADIFFIFVSSLLIVSTVTN